MADPFVVRTEYCTRCKSGAPDNQDDTPDECVEVAPGVVWCVSCLEDAVNRLEQQGPLYDPEFGDHIVCDCGHTYERHFDTYDDMAPVGCKYCRCVAFTRKTDGGKSDGG